MSATANSAIGSDYRARYYDPNAGRFITEDPIRWFSGMVDFYGYVHNDPADLIDSFGLSAAPAATAACIETLCKICSQELAHPWKRQERKSNQMAVTLTSLYICGFHLVVKKRSSATLTTPLGKGLAPLWSSGALWFGTYRCFEERGITSTMLLSQAR